MIEAESTALDTNDEYLTPTPTTAGVSLSLSPFRRAAAPAAPLGSLAADADAACASLIFASRAVFKASASAASAAAEQSRHLREASGLRACVLVKFVAGRSFRLQRLQDSGSPLPVALPLLLEALSRYLFKRGGGGVVAGGDELRVRLKKNEK